MSAPAQNDGPSPARTTARASPTSENAAVSSAMRAASNALRRSGFASVIRRTAPSRSIRRPGIRAQAYAAASWTGARPLRSARSSPDERMGLKGALAAALTPLRGDELDDAAFERYAEFLRGGGIAGVLAGGTTGEGMLLRPDERLRGITLF